LILKLNFLVYLKDKNKLKKISRLF
jgi:hypothetical protein